MPTQAPCDAVRRIPDGIVQSVDHVAIAVHDLGAASTLYGSLLGGEFLHGGDSLEAGIRTLQFAYPAGSKVELVAPLDEASPVARFLEGRGPGMHHLTLIVSDVVYAMKVLQEAGYPCVDANLESANWREVYTRPSRSHGVLMQLAETRIDWRRPRNPEVRLEDVLEGRVRWRDQMCVLAT